MLIGLAGRKSSGKDTVGAILRTRYGFRTTAFAAPLKLAVRDLFDLTREQTDGPLAVKEAIDPRWGLSPREIMQRFGTEAGRAIHPEVWVLAAMRTIDADPASRWGVTDVRFPNEAEAIRARGGLVIFVERPGFAGSGHAEGHASERLAFDADHVLVNDGTLDDLAGRVRAIPGLG